MTRPPDSDNQPPPLIWIAPSNDFPAGAWSEQRMTDNDVPYVPRTEVAAVWEKAIAIVADYGRLDRDAFYRRYGTAMLKDALEAARESEVSNEPNS